MAFSSIIQSGNFTADGNNKTLKIRSDVDKLVVENKTQWAGINNGHTFRSTWYRNLGTSILSEYHPAGDHTCAVNEVADAIELIDSSNYALGPSIAVTAGTNATRPVYTVATTGVSAGTIVRIFNSLQTNLNGLDFSIDDIDNGGTNFRLANTLATAPGGAAVAPGVTATYRVVASGIDIYNLFTPSNRNIAKVVVNGNSADVTTMVDHGFAVGQRVKFSIPVEAGMTGLDDVVGNVTVVANSATFTVDVDVSTMAAFTFPVLAAVPCQIPNVVPIGDAKSAVNQTAPSKFYNQGFIGMVLHGGSTKPGGTAADEIYWTAYKKEG